MKKLILFIFLFSMNYGCDFVETKNLIEKRSINSVKKLELQDKIVCDEEWKKIISRLTYRNIPFDNRWTEYVEFAKDLKDSFQDNCELKSNCNIWNKNNCKWIPID